MMYIDKGIRYDEDQERLIDVYFLRKKETRLATMRSYDTREEAQKALDKENQSELDKMDTESR